MEGERKLCMSLCVWSKGGLEFGCTCVVYVNSAKTETSSHCQLRLFSANLACVNICMNITRFNKKRHKLNKFLMYLGQLLLPSCTCPTGVMFGCTDPVQPLLHVVCHCEDDQLSVLSPCSAVLGVSQYGHSRRWAETLGIFLLVFFIVSRKASLVS